MEVLTHLLSSLINYGQCVSLQCLPPPPPPPPSPLQQHLGQNGDQLCAEGEMNVQQIMDAALIPSPD